MNTLQIVYKILYGLEHKEKADYMGAVIGPEKIGAENDRLVETIIMMDSPTTQPNEKQRQWYSWAAEGIGQLSGGSGARFGFNGGAVITAGNGGIQNITHKTYSYVIPWNIVNISEDYT